MSIKRTREAKELIESMAPKGEFLAYINPREAGILKAMGGSGKNAFMGIPSFTEDDEDQIAMNAPDYASLDNEEQQAVDRGDPDAIMSTRSRDLQGYGPGTNLSDLYGGSDPENIIDRIIGGARTGITSLRDRFRTGFDRTKNYLTDPTNLRNIGTTALLTSIFGPLGLVLSGIGRTQQFQDFLTNLKDKPDEIENIENTELRTFKPNPNFVLPEIKPIQPGVSPFPDISNLVADVSQKDLDLMKSKGGKMLDFETFKTLSENPTLTREEYEGIKSGTIKEPTGIYVG